ncbi:MAG: putative hydrolase [Bryobacterales bacterium]|nr:putative hydrolase [Bryobacterales bacterium]
MFENCTLAYRVEGAGPPVLMIQGVGVYGSGWLPQLAALTPHFNCLTWDHRGIGPSQPVGAKVTIAQLVDDSLALMNSQGWESAHIVGHSMGGVIAQELALRARSRVKSLTLMCTVTRGSDATSLTWFRFWTGTRTWVGPRAARRRAFLHMVLPPGEVPKDAAACERLAEHLAQYFGHDLADHPPNALKQLGALGAHDTTPRLAQLAGIPTLVVSAEHDGIAPASCGRAMAQAIPGARYVEIKGAAHGAPMMRADEVNQHLLAHLRGN